jgi:predicted HNH restriction endonuclease
MRCSVDSCVKDSYAKGLCNAHYIRNRKNKPLETPVRYFNPSKTCVECGKPTLSKGGALRCAKHFKIFRRKNLKEELIQELGGKCNMCHSVFESAVYDFHHLNDKKDSISAMFDKASIEAIKQEVKKCILLCANCHRITHARKS